MELKLYRSATVGININGFKILQDPWLTDGAYYGSWVHYPTYDLDANLDEINSYNAIYVSHIHPDHCDDQTMKKINKDIPVYIHKFHAKFLKAKLERFGFKVIEIENGDRTEISNNVFLNIFAADNCNPELCYKFLGCADPNIKGESQQIDTMCVIDDGISTLMNVNDCPIDLARSTFHKIQNQYKKIDILLVGYQNASPYPQCFDNLKINEKDLVGKKVANNCLNKALSFIESLKPKYFIPFAGTYVLAGKLSSLNKFRHVPNIDQAYDYLESNQKYSKAIRINPETSFNLNTKTVSKKFIKFDESKYQNFIKKISKLNLDYENDPIPSFEKIFDLSKKAFKKFLEKKLMNNINLSTDIFIDLEDKLIKLPYDKNELEIVEADKFQSDRKFVKYKTDIRLFKRLLLGPRYAHWNNAEIGSHINFFRNPDVFERNVYQSMCYFHN
jgi:UDP-MurNAc hydroxylase